MASSVESCMTAWRWFYRTACFYRGRSTLILEEDAIQDSNCRKSVPDFENSEDSLILLWANWWLHIETCVHHLNNPRTPQDWIESTLPVLFKYSNIAWMAAHVFITVRWRSSLGDLLPTSKDCLQDALVGICDEDVWLKECTCMLDYTKGPAVKS